MAALLESLQAAGDPRQYFHATYQRTTIAVAEELERGSFADPHWVERWDVEFADLYLAPWRPPRRPRTGPALGRRVRGPGRPGPPLRHRPLGMNAHINYDLPQALLAVITDEEFDDAQVRAERGEDHRRVYFDILSPRGSRRRMPSWTRPGGVRSLKDRLLQPANRAASKRFLRESRRKVWANAIALSRARRQGPDAYRSRPGPAGGAERGQGRGPAWRPVRCC